MGYRSEVYLGVEKKDAKKLEKVLKDHDLLEHFKKSEHNFKCQYQNDEWVDNLWYIYQASWLKWYEGYKDVDAITECIDKLSEDGDKAFQVALGEDGVVHSEIGCHWDYIEHRSELVILG